MRDKQPWHRDVVYQIYPRSFADANGDGIGDLRGVTEHLDYLKNLGVDVVWLSPVYQSPQVDNGYDISDYLAIDPTFGTLADWQKLRDGLHARRMKLVMDLVVNHSSEQHPWFVHEVRLKRLQHTLLTMKDSLEGERQKQFVHALRSILNDQNTQPTVPGLEALLTEAYAAIATFRVDSKPLPDGYPTLGAQLHNLAVALSCQPRVRAQAEANNLDFYIWHAQPNNWTSHFGGPAWHAVEGTGVCYLADFAPQQPDFNWTNPLMRAAIRAMIHTWIERGVDGFRMDVIDFIAKDPTFPDDPEGGEVGAGARFYIDRPQTHVYVRELVQELRDCGLITVGEVPGVSAAGAVQYTQPDRAELDQVFLFDHVSVDHPNGRFNGGTFHLADLKRVLQEQQNTLHARGWLANYLENHDQVRVVSRFGDDTNHRVASAKMLATLLFTLEGTPYIYQGQEIGMTNKRFDSLDQLRDVESLNYYARATAAGMDVNTVMQNISAHARDNVRTPMQWNGGMNAGFSAGKPWMDVNDNYTSINVYQSLIDQNSPWYTYRDLIALRRGNDVLLYGDFQLLWPDAPRILAFTRTLDEQKLTVLLNFSGRSQKLPDRLPQGMRLLYGTATNAPRPDAPLAPFEARILQNPVG